MKPIGFPQLEKIGWGRFEVLTLSASVLFYIPMVRELALWTRCIDARKSVATKALKKKHSFLAVFFATQKHVVGAPVCSSMKQYFGAVAPVLEFLVWRE